MRLTQVIAKAYLIGLGILGTVLVFVISMLVLGAETTGGSNAFSLVLSGFVIVMAVMGVWIIWAHIWATIRGR